MNADGCTPAESSRPIPLYPQVGKAVAISLDRRYVTAALLTVMILACMEPTVTSTAMPTIIGDVHGLNLYGWVSITTGMAGLFLLALLHAPGWSISAILGVTGFGFGFVSMGCVLGVQDAVAWQQRGIVTSGVQFCRTFGGAVGIGLLGGILNTVIAPGSARLSKQGLALTQILDPTRHATLPLALLREAQHTLAGGLTWVFFIMFALCLLGLYAATRFQPGRSGRAVSNLETIEAAAAA